MEHTDNIEEVLAVIRHNLKLNARIIGGRKEDQGTLGTLVNIEGHIFAAEFKRSLPAETIGAVVHYISRLPQRGILIAPYINRASAEALRKQNIPFLDMAGNAYLNEPNLFVFVKGERPAVKAVVPEVRGAAFQPTGLKVIFAFVRRPELIMAPYREIASGAGVALGTVGWVMRDLRGQGFLLELSKGIRKLVERERLIKEWANRYPTTLRPKLLVGRYRALRPGWWENTKPAMHGGMWGGEVAAARLTQYLQPATWTVYVNGEPGKLVILNNLREAPNGDIEFLKAFWPAMPGGQEEELVHPLLIYADLLTEGGQRNLETAQIVYEKYLMGFIGAA